MEHSMTLVIFTFLSQLAIGAFAALFFMDTYKQTVSKRAGFISLIAILSVSVIAVIVSVFHLGHPFAAYRAILNFDDSWLTREIVFFPSFILFVFVYTFFTKTDGMKKWIGWIAVFLGGITIFCTAMIYTIPAIPAWNNGMTTAAFFATALLTGPVFIQVLLTVIEGKGVNFSLYTLVVSGIAILLNVINLTILKGGFAEAAETASILTANPLFIIKMIVLLIGFAFALNSIMKKSYTLTTGAVIFVCFFAAEFIGRMLFYATGIHL